MQENQPLGNKQYSFEVIVNDN